MNGAKEGVAKNFSQNKTNCAIDNNNGFELFFFRRILVMWFALTMWVVEWNFIKADVYLLSYNNDSIDIIHKYMYVYFSW